jgi:hypothetical protein
MKLVPANRVVDGVKTRVFAYGSATPLPEDAIIDMDAVGGDAYTHYYRVFLDGDLVELAIDGVCAKEKRAETPKINLDKE